MSHVSSYSYDHFQQSTYRKKQKSDIVLPFNTMRMKTKKMMMMKRVRMIMKKLRLKRRLKEREKQLLRLQKQ